MNKIILSGRITKDIELRSTTNNISVVQNAIAVKNDFKNKNGEYDSEFINFIVYRNNAEYLSKYGSKGCMVLIEGRLTNRSYQKQDGTKGYITEVVSDKLELLSFKLKENTEQEEVKEDILDKEVNKFANEIELYGFDMPF